MRVIILNCNVVPLQTSHVARAAMFSSAHADLDSLLADLKSDAVGGVDVAGSGGDESQSTGAALHNRRALFAHAAMWDASVAPPACAVACSEVGSAVKRGDDSVMTSPSPVVEALRKKAVRVLHARLETLVAEKCGSAVLGSLALKSSVTLRNGDATFDRWLLSSMLRRGASSTAGGQSVSLDPLLPTDGAPNSGLVDELVKAGSEQSAATTVAEVMAQTSHKMALSLTRQQLGVARRAAAVTKVMADAAARVVRVKCGKKAYKVGADHYTKLRELYQCHASTPEPLTASARWPREQEARFRDQLASLIIRYEALGGSGYQAACSAAVFDVMHRRFAVAMECFASPFNCRWSRFCSAFADTDAAFGSVGSFFAFRPTTGSYEANPPFEPLLITAMQVSPCACVVSC